MADFDEKYDIMTRYYYLSGIMQFLRKFVIIILGLFILAGTPLAYGGGGSPHDEFGTTVESLQKELDDLVNSGKKDPATIQKMADLNKQMSELKDGLFGAKTPIPSMFAEGGGCTFDAGSGSVSCKPGILGSACEVVMAGLRSEKNEGGAVNPRSLTCTEFVDPLPARFMNGYKDGGTYCIQQIEIASGGNKDNVNTYKFTNDYGANTYCIGLLHKTGDGDLTPILGFVMFIYNLMQPLLIIGGVIALVVAGIFIMYAPGGEGDTIKKGKEMLIRIISGFLLFFMIKVFLSTINGNFFSSTPTGSSTSTESTVPAGGATEQGAE